jgi:tRNA U38,U39,U40 pseudouridine synthase TruA
MEETASTQQVLSIEVTGDRFLRRMVRILVATALQLAVTVTAGEVDDLTRFNAHQLIELCASRNRERTTKPAPPGGLIFAGAFLWV